MNIKLITQVTLVVAIGVASSTSTRANTPLDGSRSYVLHMEQAAQEAYIEQYSFLAVDQMIRYGVPASVTLGQGILESNSGTSRLAVDANNHFGIKCKSDWPGETLTKSSREEDENGFSEMEVSCFRAYKSVQQSYEDHSKFLNSRPAYEQLMAKKVYDYKVWAHTLLAAGYATDKVYPSKLIRVIERYNLMRFDQIALDKIEANGSQVLVQNDRYLLGKVKTEAERRVKEIQQAYDNCKKYSQETISAQAIELANLRAELNSAKTYISKLEKQVEKLAQSKDPFGNNFADAIEASSTKTARKIYLIYPELDLDYNSTGIVNGSRSTVVQEGQGMTAISEEFGIDKDLLYKYNDMSVGTALVVGQYIFLEAKQPKVTTDLTAHEVMVGETVHSISQRYGIQTNVLRKRNRLKAGEEPQVRQHIYLNSKNPTKPALQSINYRTPQSNW